MPDETNLMLVSERALASQVGRLETSYPGQE